MIIKLKSSAFLLILLIPLFVFSQKKEKPLTWKQKQKIADYQYSIASYYVAIDYYHKVLEDKPDYSYAAYMLAESYFNGRDYRNAEKYYQKTLDLDPSKYPLAAYQHPLTLKLNGSYELARAKFKIFAKEYTGKDVEILKKKAREQIKGCDLALELIKNPLLIEVKHIDENVNAPYTEFAPIPVSDSALIYSSLRSDTVIMLTNVHDQEQQLAKMFRTTRRGSGWAKSIALPPIINSQEAHIGNCSFSPDGSRFYFTKCIKNTFDNKVRCDIYLSEIKDGQYQEPVKLNEFVNDPKSTNTHPTISNHPTKAGYDVLYFVTDRPGGKGGLDIWVTNRNDKGEFTEASPLSGKVNSIFDDITPFYDIPNNQLYFSSNRGEGMGGYDIYKSEGVFRKFADAVNVGYPVNTGLDDIYFSINSKGTGGFLVSNRPGTIGLKSETCCDDIFEFNYIKKIDIAVNGSVFEEGDENKNPLTGSVVSLYLSQKGFDLFVETNKRKHKTEVTLIDNEDIFIKNDTIKEGKELYFFNLRPGQTYKLVASKNGYMADLSFVSTLEIQNSDTLKADFTLKKIEINKEIILENIFYDFDKATLRPESKLTLDTLALVLRQNPELEVEISAYTDNKGEDDYNLELSQRRAESVVNYLLAFELNQKHLVARGYGESNPIAPNTNTDGSDNPDGRQLNRRTSFKIIAVREKVLMELGE